MKNWFDNLRNAIKEAGYTQAEFAKKIGYSQPMVSQWLSGDRTPNVNALRRMAEELNKTLTEILGDQAVILESDDEREFMARFRMLSDENKAVISKMLRALDPTED